MCFKFVSTLVISYFIISVFCFLQSSFSFTLAVAKYEKYLPHLPPKKCSAQFVFHFGEGSLEDFNVFSLERAEFSKAIFQQMSFIKWLCFLINLNIFLICPAMKM